MKAVRIHQYGSPENLVYEDAPKPILKKGEVLIQVYAIGVNPVDQKTRAGGGIAGWLGNDIFPLILGWDVAGVIVETAGNTKLSVGDRVYGMVGFPGIGSAYAEYVAAPESQLAKVPDQIDFTTAAATPLVALTAWQALFDAAHLQSLQRVLIHGAAGGVGHIAVQIAKLCGAHVIGTASARNKDYLKSLGVDEVIDYAAQRFEQVIEPVDLVLDTIGGDTLTRSFEVVKPGGKIISIAEQPNQELAQQKGIEAQLVVVKTSGAQLAIIAGLLSANLLKPTLEQVIPLDSAADAHRLSATGHVRGKIVLSVI